MLSPLRHLFAPADTAAAVLCVCVLLSACVNLDYYGQTVRGQLDLMERRQPIATVMSDPDASDTLKDRLRLSQEARDFASDELLLPDNQSYRTYADLERPYAVWLVVATGEFSVDPHRWCFVFAGCFSYRGYFDKAAAESFGDDLVTKGYDVHITGGIAYSTLGWFDDPVLNTMLDRSDTAIVSLLFHELAHQQLYIRDDTAFNEAFAVAVEREGMKRWLGRQDDESRFPDYLANRKRQDEFYALLAYYRAALSSMYAGTRPVAEKRHCKARVLKQLRASYNDLKQRWGGYDGFDEWMAKDINNASLALVATYQGLVPGFQRLLNRHEGNLHVFYREAEQLGKLPPAERYRQLRNATRDEATGTCPFCRPATCVT